MNRREFLRTTAALTGATGIVACGFAQTAPSSTTASRRRKLHPFRYREVKLTGGPLKAQFDSAFDFFMKQDESRVLQPYRKLAGVPTADAGEMGGWYNVGAFAPGHSFGQWVSALSRFADATGDAAAREKVARLVHGFAETLAGPRSFYDDHRFKAYCYDKHVIGLVEAHELAGVTDARDVLAKATDLAVRVLPGKALTREEMRQRPHRDVSYTWDESYTMPENLFAAHEAFSDARYLDLAKRYLHDQPYFHPLAEGKNALVGQHAYSHVNALSSAARAYLVLGGDMHRRAAVNAWDMIAAQSYASGGWGPNEAFVEPGKGKLFESLASTHNHFETPCGAYAHFKLARYLMSITGESRYGDSLERMLYNGILAAQSPRPDGSTFYYSDYHAHARKSYHPDKWPCCSGTYPQVIADYLVSMCFRDDSDGIFVNLYAPSELKWNDLTLTQTTEYPRSDRISFRLGLGGAKRFALNLRIPAWAQSASISVNREAAPAPQPGRFARLDRTWRDGDAIELTLPMSDRTEPIDEQHPDIVALLRGPVLFVAVDGPLKVPRNAALGGSLAAGEVRFLPFHQVRDETYTTYFTQT